MRVSRLAALALAGMMLPAVVAVSPAPAAAQQPWCAVYASAMGRTLNCAFRTREQCLAGVRGVGTCEPISSDNSPGTAPSQGRRQRHH